MSELQRLLEPAYTFLTRVPAGTALAAKARASDLDQLARSAAKDHPLPMAGEVPQLIDHTILKPEAGPADIERLCQEARQAAFASVCVNSSHVERAARNLVGSGVKVSAVVGFPLGAAASLAKALETAAAIEDGALEIDMVLAIGLLRAADYEAVAGDIAAVAAVAHAGGALLKVIFENALLTPAQQAAACLLVGGGGRGVRQDLHRVRPERRRGGRRAADACDRGPPGGSQSGRRHSFAGGSGTHGARRCQPHRHLQRSEDHARVRAGAGIR